MFGPAGAATLAVLVAAFAALLYALVRARHLALKALAGTVALLVASVFGMGVVNRHYDYYASWGALYGSLTDRGSVAVRDVPGRVLAVAPDARAVHPRRMLPAPNAAASSSARRTATLASAPARAAVPSLLTASRFSGHGTVEKLRLAGAVSGIERSAYVYLPPQYADPAYAAVKFPVAELVHGDPGEPGSWIYGLTIATVLDSQINHGTIGPVIVVMPASFSGSHGQECLDAVSGDKDETYLAVDVPADIASQFRTTAPGHGWAIGGLSDGGFCAANLALRHPRTFVAAAVMDGYFSPSVTGHTKDRAFGGDASLARANDPSREVRDSSHRLPQFWIMAGTANSTDFNNARAFAQLVQAREPVSFLSVEGGDHTTPAWRTALPEMLKWISGVVSPGTIVTGEQHIPLAH